MPEVAHLLFWFGRICPGRPRMQAMMEKSIKLSPALKLIKAHSVGKACSICWICRCKGICRRWMRNRWFNTVLGFLPGGSQAQDPDWVWRLSFPCHWVNRSFERLHGYLMPCFSTIETETLLFSILMLAWEKVWPYYVILSVLNWDWSCLGLRAEP